MRDRVFSGPDVEEAIAVAAASLGLPRAELRYVVLEPGTAAGRGLKPTPARIAVFLPEPRREASAAGERQRTPAAAPAQAPDPRAGLRETIRAVAQAGGLEVGAEVEENEAAVVVRLHGADEAFFLGEDGRGEVLRATEHLLLRLYGAALQPRALRLTCEGFRDRRDEALAGEAHRMAEAVRNEGQPRTMEPHERLRATHRSRGSAGRAGRHHLQRGPGLGPAGDGGAGRPRRESPEARDGDE